MKGEGRGRRYIRVHCKAYINEDRKLRDLQDSIGTFLGIMETPDLLGAEISADQERDNLVEANISSFTLSLSLERKIDRINSPKLCLQL
jgi:hypothetical protein